MYNRKKEIIKSTIIIGFILFISVFSTYKIYYHFSQEEKIDYSSKSLDITFNEKDGNELNIVKITPLTDAVGLSSMLHSMTVTNNLTEPVGYTIKISDNLEKIKEEKCEELDIPKEEIKISIKKNNGQTEIYTLAELEENPFKTEIGALKEDKYSIRIWISSDTTLQSSSTHHYHGLIQIYENDNLLAIK